MAGALMDVSVHGLEPLSEDLLAMAERAGDLTDAMDEIGGMLVTSTLQRFEDGVGPDGEAWPVSARAEADSGQTLVDRGHLRDSITHVASRDSVRVGTNVIYGGIHQFGGVIERNNAELPARPYLGVSDADRAEAMLIVEDHLAEGLDGGAP